MTYNKKALYYAFKQYFIQIFKDAMLAMLCVAPVLCGLFFKYGIPFIESLLLQYLDLSDFLVPYYLLFDLLLGSLTPIMYCFAAAYVMLGEVDDGISKYLAVTPLGKKGYLVSRLGIPAVIAFVVSIVTLGIFSLSKLSLMDIVIISFITSLLGIATALLVVSLSGNKVEGMAVSKLCGLLFLGLPAPFFLSGKIQFSLFFLPSFWVAKYAADKNIIFVICGIIVSITWLMLLYKKFIKKIR